MFHDAVRLIVFIQYKVYQKAPLLSLDFLKKSPALISKR